MQYTRSLKAATLAHSKPRREHGRERGGETLQKSSEKKFEVKGGVWESAPCQKQ